MGPRQRREECQQSYGDEKESFDMTKPPLRGRARASTRFGFLLQARRIA
jgi:hypothetical protein